MVEVIRRLPDARAEHLDVGVREAVVVEVEAERADLAPRETVGEQRRVGQRPAASEVPRW